MGSNPRVLESQLYNIWKNQKYSRELKTISGEGISVLDAGSENVESGGPDFKNARIRIGNLTYVGDIEIDSDYRDWKSHGHNINGKYNKVILHASLFNKFNQPYVYTKDGRKVPTICLSDHLGEGILEEIGEEAESNKERQSHQLRCCVENGEIDNNTKEKFISNLGIERFKKKCNKFYQRLKELRYLQELKIKEPVINYDLAPEFGKRKFSYEDFKDKYLWQQLFYENLFEALGYSKNKGIMLNVSRAVTIEVLRNLDIKDKKNDKIESILFNISGMIQKSETHKDSETVKYISDLRKYWMEIKDRYDGKTFDEVQWHFFKLRPQNFPTIRLAAGARL